MKIVQLPILICLIALTSCKNSEGNLIPNSETTAKEKPSKDKVRELSEAFKTYWYAGNAEITSYKLLQERYGEVREGTAVNIFVTEDFLKKEQVKADNASEENIPVLKLNQTKKYVTGIYPYSVMTSIFTPTNSKNNAIKISHSTQEWCGHVYVQLNNREDFKIQSHSYFEGEADQEFSLEKTWLENDLWSYIRMNPEELPTGDFTMIPSFEYFRMSHKKIEAHEASASVTVGDSISNYEVMYPSLKRKLKIYFSSTFPYTIERWEETNANGLVTSAEKMKRIQTAYWNQKSTTFEHLRDTLGL
ncbi:septum formation inhibitor Maf [Rasiella sp. SM2506]|uniref:septum formation inhibitor Maf n=1 Tax=Rasiella sp. SM2506 TaxID=3423914 RepID=UPI003D7B598B